MHSVGSLASATSGRCQLEQCFFGPLGAMEVWTVNEGGFVLFSQRCNLVGLTLC